MRRRASEPNNKIIKRNLPGDRMAREGKWRVKEQKAGSNKHKLKDKRVFRALRRRRA
jgi:hypothetical protein